MIKFAKNNIDPDEFIANLKSRLDARVNLTNFISVLIDPSHECKVTARLYYNDEIISVEDVDVDVYPDTQISSIDAIPASVKKVLVFRTKIKQNMLKNPEKLISDSIEFSIIDIHTGERLYSFCKMMSVYQLFKNITELDILYNLFLDNPNYFLEDAY